MSTSSTSQSPDLKSLPSDSVYESLQALLYQKLNVITTPEHLREKDLAIQLGVSRTPIREALNRLATVGLIELHPGRGAILTPITDTAYVEWLSIRAYLEAFAARETAKNITKHEVDSLRELFSDFQKTPEADWDMDHYAKTNVHFHQTIILLAHNKLLTGIWDLFSHRQVAARRNSIKLLRHGAQSLKEHLSLIDAFDRREPDLAEAIAKDHVESLLALFRAYKSNVRPD